MRDRDDFLVQGLGAVVGALMLLLLVVWSAAAFSGISDSLKCRKLTGFYNCGLKGKEQIIRVEDKR